MQVKLVNENFKTNYIDNLLLSRGIKNLENFKNPTYDDIESWGKLSNIEQAIAIFREIVDIKEQVNIGTIVDCDADGLTSASILVNYLKKNFPQIAITTYFHEHKQHGLEDVWEAMVEKDCDLIIIADASSNDGQFIKEFNCPVIVLDHHELEPDSEIPPNMILINNQTSSTYNNKALSGAGIAWQFCRALDDHYGFTDADNYLDLCAVGVCGDVMDGREVENQAIWKLGFSNIKNYGLQKFIEAQSYSMGGKINPTTIAFYIVPLINATIRVGSMSEKERLFKAFINGHELVPSNKRGEKGLMTEVVNEAIREATNNRSKQNKILDSAMDSLEIKISKYDLLEHKILFVRLEDEVFPSELNGLLAMRLSQKYQRPTIVARLNDESYDRGSARGLSNCELTDFKAYLEQTGLFEYTAGHSNACGCSLPDKNLTQLMKIADTDLADYDFSNNVYEVNFERPAVAYDLNDLITEIALNEAIWSTNNKEPLIYITDLNFNARDIQIMGTHKDTVKIEKNGIAFMKFHAIDLINEIQELGEIKMNLVGRANLNSWMGRITPQIFIENYEIEDGELSF